LNLFCAKNLLRGEILKLTEKFLKFGSYPKVVLVITWDYKEKETYKNKTIKYVPLWKWLLENI